MKTKKHLSFGSLIDGLSNHLNELPDNRQEEKSEYTIHDAFMSGFACMYFQDPSLLQFQQRLKQNENRDNLETLFNVGKTPESTQLKKIIDDTSSYHFRSVFKDYFSRLQRGKHLEQYQVLPGLYACSIDGTQYFSSKRINCSNCLVTNHKSGEITYSHKVLQAAIMHPDIREVIPLMPEEIVNSDGNSKQDCEINAAKRFIPKIRMDHPKLGLIIVGDGLFSKQPFISDVLSNGMHYVLIAKPDDHTYLMEWIDMYDELNTISYTDDKGRTHQYEWMNNVPLNAREDAINTNFFRYRMIVTDKTGRTKVTYKNSWVTDLEITEQNVITLVKVGRSRWKIENECFNTLKNQGYHIEHSYGHGNNNLCFNFYLLTLLAFFFHQIFELTDRLYQECRKKFGSKRHMWENLRSFIKLFVFDTWEFFLVFAMEPAKHIVSRPP